MSGGRIVVARSRIIEVCRRIRKLAGVRAVSTRTDCHDTRRKSWAHFSASCRIFQRGLIFSVETGMTIPLRTLNLLLAGTILLPAGWCCAAEVSECCEVEKPASTCCQHEETPAPAQTSDCACDFPHVYSVSGSDSDPIVAATLPSEIIENSHRADSITVAPAAVRSNRPPIHVLHCVWLR